jgi:signal transduction histidine kinase
MTFSYFDTLVRSVAHDLRNAFDTLVMGLELLREDPDTSPESQQTVEMLSISAHRGAHLFRDVLRQLKELSPNTEDLDLREVVGEVRDEIAPQLPAGVVLDVVLPARRPGTVRCNPHLVKVVLLELIRNAAKASATCGGCVRVRLQTGRRTVTIVVDDEGPGIPPIVQDYFRNPEVARNSDVGTGLVLSAQLVRTFGGELCVDRTSSQGSTVTVTLPRPAGHGKMETPVTQPGSPHA